MTPIKILLLFFAVCVQAAPVAVIDSGIVEHSGMTNILPGYDFLTQNSRDGDGYDAFPRDEGTYTNFTHGCVGLKSDSSWHGTMVSSLINHPVVPVRVIGPCGPEREQISKAILWAIGDDVGVPINPNPIKVINLSLGNINGTVQPCPADVQIAINKAHDKGVTIVAAAGNENRDMAGVWPANCNHVIAVAAYNPKTHRKEHYSNYGNLVDVSAPGADLYMFANHSKKGPYRMPYGDTIVQRSGTSFAAPLVSDLVAAMYDKDPTITPDRVELLLKRHARPFPCTGCGAGVVDRSVLEHVQAPSLPTVYHNADKLHLMHDAKVYGGDAVYLTHTPNVEIHPNLKEVHFPKDSSEYAIRSRGTSVIVSDGKLTVTFTRIIQPVQLYFKNGYHTLRVTPPYSLSFGYLKVSHAPKQMITSLRSGRSVTAD